MDSTQPQEDVLSRATQVLEAHGVVALPTETFYGLAVSAFDARACERIFELKGRPSTKALACIVADMAQLDAVAAEISPWTRALGSRFWPGPLTLIVPAKASVAASSEDGTVAVRVSSLPLARELAACAGPITATSANRSGAPPATSADDVIAGLGDAVDLILDGGTTPGGLPSTIVAVASGRPRLVRKGAVDFRDVSETLTEPGAQS